MNKKLVILGAGESGTGTAVLAKSKGWDVFVSDMGKIAENYRHELEKIGVRWEEGKHTESEILSADEMVKSPGIPDKAHMVQAAMKKGIPVISEIEFAGRYTDAKMVCISGTNGKTTTTLLTHHILKNAGLNVGLGGNIGKSFARQVAEENHDIYVLEVSSFQLDGNYKFRSHISVLTNITPDHLDRYEYKMELYAASKYRLTRNQQASDYFIYCQDDPISMQYFGMKTGEANTLPISITKACNQGAYVENNTLFINNNKQTMTINMEEISLRGIHNTYNSMAAAVVASLLDVRKETIRESLCNFQNAEHRLEHVNRVNGVEYINDSKATNVNSAWYALESMDKPVVWIAGGVDKGNNYKELKSLVKEKVKYIICLGLDNIKIHQAFQDDVDMIINTGSAKEAVHVASRLAQKGDCVLLSPACASFDLFDNYEDRGRQFKEAVRKL
ncbi:MAG: UDP-N-acetylmuramoyl-L-alanine--D-glutamate ligase [Sphingomonadales bacterium]|nr:UDP-N-acetylmuramoyl-L-alanine--D-glutamate ligase [Sphingomonadales bacterium]